MSNQSSQKGSTSQIGSTLPSWASPGSFNPQSYLAANPDVAASGMDPAQHWQQFGQNEGRSGSGFNDAYSNMNSILQTAPMAIANQTFQQGGLGSTAQNAIGQLAGGQNFQNIYNTAGQPGAAQNYLSGTAQGDYLNGSPFLNNIIDKTNQKVSDQTNQLFANSGRYGSGVHQGTLADSIAQNTSNLLNQNYQQERDRQLQAAGAISGEQGNRLGQQLGAASGVQQGLGQAAGLENQGFTNLLGMISALPAIQGNKLFDANQQMQIGGQIDQTAQNRLNDLISQWQKSDQEGWSRLGGLISGGTGVAGNFGTQSGTGTSQQGLNPLQAIGLLGGLALAPVTGGGSLFGNFASSLFK